MAGRCQNWPGPNCLVFAVMGPAVAEGCVRKSLSRLSVHSSSPV
jgi:hypothetical protein